MDTFLTLAFLFFIGSIVGWVLELLFRNLVHRPKHWVNPGFCRGPYLPIYGFGLCSLYLLAALKQYNLIRNPFWNKAVLFAVMALGMTLIEYIAGIFCLKYLKVRLWDYSNQWGNIQGIVCPLFSLFWAVLGAVYYFLIHPHILDALHWLSCNLAFSFFIGAFYGVFIIDVCQSSNLIVRLKIFAEENEAIIKYEAIKEHIASVHAKNKMRYRFFNPFHGDRPITEFLKDMKDSFEKRSKRHSQ